jgi:radical SAM superfamily enzyme YgiQ (UPF0313 family)
MTAQHPRLLLVGPTALDGAGRPITQSRIHLPGLTLPMLAAVTPSHWEVRLVSETVSPIPFGERWDLVGLTGMGSGLARAWQIADRFRAGGVPVVIGGIAATLLGPEVSLPHADAVVLGEAEEVWPTVLADWEAGRLQRIYRAQRPPPIETLPLPRYDLMDRRTIGFWRPVQAARGCPFSCDYCSITAYHEQRYRKRPVEQVIRDVRAAKRAGTRYIAFIDDNIGVDWNYCRELWTALVPERITWMSQCSLHIADRPEMMKLAWSSGCRLLSVGIESVNPASLEEHEKGWNRPERYAAAIQALRAHGIEISTEMIIGMDADDETIFERTYDFIMGNRIPVPRVHILTPVAGTPLHRRLQAQERLIPVAPERFTGGTVTFVPRRLTPERLQAGYWELYRRLFTWRAIAHRIGPNRARLGPYMRAVVTGVNLHYRNHIRRGITPGIV